MDKFLVFALPVAAIGLLFSCSSDVESCPGTGNSSSAQPVSSSSGLPSGPVLCEVSGICTELSGEVCALLGGTAVQSCPASSSSAVLPSSSSSVVSQSGVVYGSSVTYEGETYQTVVIGSQTWFAKNLNYNVSGSKCYSNSTSNCDTYGRLYDWSTAMGLPSSCNSSYCSSQIQSPHRGICPSGWHIPSNADWDKLYRYADGTNGTSSPYDSPTAGRYLKATSGWSSGGNGTDQYGFSALPGGYGCSSGSFFDVGYYGYWWSATEINASNAYSRGMSISSATVIRNDYNKSYLYSVRCVQD